MAVTYDWVFGPLETAISENNLEKVVKVVHWRLNAVDGDYTETSYGTVSLPEPDAADFVAFDDITKDDVQGWVEAALGAEQVVTMKEHLADSINAKKNPTKVNLTPPWETV